jgi:hypothetical protein
MGSTKRKDEDRPPGFRVRGKIAGGHRLEVEMSGKGQQECVDGERGGPTALELTITYRGASPPTVDKRRVRAQVLPSLDRTPGVPLPPDRLELLDAAGDVIYRRAFPRPGHVEVHGPSRRWTPAAMPQVLIALVPELADATRVVAHAVAVGPWLDEPLP